MVVLLFWDLLCFLGVGSLYVCSLTYLAENPHPVDPFAFSCDAYGLGCDSVPGGISSGNASATYSGPLEAGLPADLYAASQAAEAVWDEAPRVRSVWTNWQVQTMLHAFPNPSSSHLAPCTYQAQTALRT